MAASSGLRYSFGWLGLPQAGWLEQQKLSIAVLSCGGCKFELRYGLGWFLLGSGKKAISWFFPTSASWLALEFPGVFLIYHVSVFHVVFLCMHVCVYD